MRNLEEYNGRHSDRTCFIVAPGPSVYFEDLSSLGNHITIAVNGGILAFPQADFFISDDWSVANWSYFQKDLRKSKSTVLLYEDKLKSAAHLFGERSVLFRHRKGYKITDRYSHSESAEHIWEARSSAGSAIHVAHIMGCKQIVLVGFDCKRIQGNRYFWQFPKHDKRTWCPEPSRSDRVKTDRFRKTTHEGRDTDTDLIEILKYWRKVGKAIQPHCRVLNATNHSAIDVFPSIRLQELLSSLEDGNESRERQCAVRHTSEGHIEQNT
jgi:hypothetical protein